MAVSSPSHTKRMDALSTSVVVEDGSEDVRHDDDVVDREVPVKVGELTDPMAGVISLDRQSIKILVGTSIRIR